MTCLIWQCLTSFNIGFYHRMNAFLQYTHMTVLVFYRIVPLQAVKQSVSCGKRSDCLMDSTSCSSLTSASLSLARLSGMHPQHRRSGPGLLSFFCSSGFLWSCSLTLHDEFSIGEPFLTSLHIILFPWHAQFSVWWVSQLRAQTNFTFSSQMQQPLLVLPLSEIC